MPCGGSDGRHRHDRGVARAERPQRRVQVAPGAHRRPRPRSALVTTSTSGTSMIPAFRNCSTSPEPGCTTTATVSATSATSVSDWPTPTVSITTTSKAAASAWAAARVAGARPPSRSPAAVERMNTPRSAGSRVDPRAVAEQRAAGALGRGSTASTATAAPAPPPRRHQLGEQRRLARAGRAGHPRRCGAGASPPSAAGGRPRAAAPRPPARAAGARLSTRLRTAGAAPTGRASRRRAPSSAPLGLSGSRGGGHAVALGHERDDVAHDPR